MGKGPIWSVSDTDFLFSGRCFLSFHSKKGNGCVWFSPQRIIKSTLLIFYNQAWHSKITKKVFRVWTRNRQQRSNSEGCYRNKERSGLNLKTGELRWVHFFAATDSYPPLLVHLYCPISISPPPLSPLGFLPVKRDVFLATVKRRVINKDELIWNRVWCQVWGATFRIT